MADGLNGLILLGRGDYVGAGLSFVSMVPIFGDIVGKGGKITRYAVQYSDEAAVAMKELNNGASRIWSQTVVAPTSVLRKLDDGIPSTGIHALDLAATQSGSFSQKMDAIRRLGYEVIEDSSFAARGEFDVLKKDVHL